MNFVINLNTQQLKSVMEDADHFGYSAEVVIQKRLSQSLIKGDAPQPQKEPRNEKPITNGQKGKDLKSRNAREESARAQNEGKIRPKPHNSKEPFKLMGGHVLETIYGDIVGAAEPRTVTVENLMSILHHVPKFRKFTLRELLDALHPDVQKLIGPALRKSLAQSFYKKVKTLPKSRNVRYDGSVSPIQYWVES